MMEAHHHHTLGFLLAGLIPVLGNFPYIISIIYYLLLIPPAAYHCYSVLRQQIIPSIVKYFKSD